MDFEKCDISQDWVSVVEITGNKSKKEVPKNSKIFTGKKANTMVLIHYYFSLASNFC